jgi:hypothetical protein
MFTMAQSRGSPNNELASLPRYSARSPLMAAYQALKKPLLQIHRSKTERNGSAIFATTLGVDASQCNREGVTRKGAGYPDGRNIDEITRSLLDGLLTKTSGAATYPEVLSGTRCICCVRRPSRSLGDPRFLISGSVRLCRCI